MVSRVIHGKFNRNTNKKSQGSPDYRGLIEVGGVQFWGSCWKKRGTANDPREQLSVRLQVKNKGDDLSGVGVMYLTPTGSLSGTITIEGGGEYSVTGTYTPDTVKLKLTDAVDSDPVPVGNDGPIPCNLSSVHRAKLEAFARERGVSPEVVVSSSMASFIDKYMP